MQPYLAELIGTMMLVLLGDGVVANVVLTHQGANSGWIVITTGWGIAVAIAVYAVGRISGAHLNPAVTIALATIGSFPWADVPGYIGAQMIGAFAGAVAGLADYLPHWASTPDPGAKLGGVRDRTRDPQHRRQLISEIIGTAVLMFGILAIAAQRADAVASPGDVDLSFVFSRGLQPLLVGVLVLGIGVSLGGPTGYAINPARDLGRASRTRCCRSPERAVRLGYAWIPVVGPIIGGIAGAGALLPIDRLLNGRSLTMARYVGARRPGHDQHALHGVRQRRQRDRPPPARAPADPAAAGMGRARSAARSRRASTR